MGWAQTIFPQRRRIPGVPDDVLDQIDEQMRTRGGDVAGGAPMSEPAIPRMPVGQPLELTDVRRPDDRSVMGVERMPASNPAEPLPQGQFGRLDALRAGGVSEPAIARMTNLQHGVTPEEQGYIERPAVVVPNEPVRPKVERGGFLGTLGHMGQGFLQGLALGAPMGGGQAIGAGLTGAILGAANPQAIANLKFDRMTMPKFERQRSKAEEEIAKREQMIERIGKRTGYDPVTGQQTGEARERDENQDIRREQIAGMSESRASSRRAEAVNTALRAQAEWDQRHPNEPYPEHITSALPNLKGERAPKTPPKATLPHWAQDANGTWVDLNSAKGPVRGRVPRDPNEMTAYQMAQDQRANEREDRADRREQEQRISAAETNLKRARREVDIRKAVMADAKATPEQKAQAKQHALSIIDEVTSSHPDLLEGGEGDGGFPYLKWKGGKRPEIQSASPARRSSGGQPRSGHKVGDAVTVNGKTVRIGKIYPDGSFDPE